MLSPVAQSANIWGYRVGIIGGFGVSPTTSATSSLTGGNYSDNVTYTALIN